MDKIIQRIHEIVADVNPWAFRLAVACSILFAVTALAWALNRALASLMRHGSAKDLKMSEWLDGVSGILSNGLAANGIFLLGTWAIWAVFNLPFVRWALGIPIFIGIDRMGEYQKIKRSCRGFGPAETQKKLAEAQGDLRKAAISAVVWLVCGGVGLLIGGALGNGMG